MKEDLLRRLDLKGPEVELKLSTVLSEKVIKGRRIEGLVVRDYNEVAEIALPKSYSRSSIPAKRSQIPRPESALNWPHLKKIAAKIMPLNEDIEVGLLIGLNCSRAIKPLEVIPVVGIEQEEQSLSVSSFNEDSEESTLVYPKTTERMLRNEMKG